VVNEAQRQLDRPLRVAVAGTGFIGRVHARAAVLAGATLVGVSASTAEHARVAAIELGAQRWFDSSEALVADEAVDVVHVCTPNHLHAPLVERALAAGKHVVCEKPLATSHSDAERLVAAAEAAGVVATVPFVYRYYPTVREARARVQAGETGQIRLVHGCYLQDWLANPEDDNWRVDAALGGPSRAFADIGSHWCDLAEWMTGQRITRLAARVVTTVPKRAHDPHRQAFAGASGGGGDRVVTTEDAATVLFETNGGAIGTLVVSQVSPGRKNHLWLELDGERAALAFDQEQPEVLWVGSRSGPRLVLRDPAILSPPARPYATLPAGHPQGYRDCFDAFVADTYAAVRGDEPEGLPRFGDGRRAARITEAVLESAASQHWEEVPA
jgi:predicted dehydrogenase